MSNLLASVFAAFVSGALTIEYAIDGRPLTLVFAISLSVMAVANGNIVARKLYPTPALTPTDTRGREDAAS